MAEEVFMTELMTFLSDLKADNSREWMSENKSRYHQIRDGFNSFVAEIIRELGQMDHRFAALNVKECVLRLNRDIRFSQNKTPYKTSFAAVMAPEGGKKSVLPCYYVSLSPDDSSFMAAGLYLPRAEYLKKVRQEIDYEGDMLEQIINDPIFTDTFGQIEGEQLKTVPRGYDPSYEKLSLLRYKSFIIKRELSDDLVASEDFLGHLLHLYKRAKPFNDFFFRALL